MLAMKVNQLLFVILVKSFELFNFWKKSKTLFLFI